MKNKVSLSEIEWFSFQIEFQFVLNSSNLSWPSETRMTKTKGILIKSVTVVLIEVSAVQRKNWSVRLGRNSSEASRESSRKASF